jgi:hypothetical protein
MPDGAARAGKRPIERPIESPSERPALIVVIDTEEEYDWDAPFNRDSVGVGHMRQIGRLQALCERWGIRPVYVIDYPIASQAPGIEALRPLLQSGTALVGAHLHPWVSPPHEEAVNERNSFPGNLPPALERAKLATLSACIEERLGVRPRIYKAGRYGIGESSFAILEELGFTVDLSPSPPFDYRPAGGVDFSKRGLAPEWVGPHGSVLSIPGTGALIGRMPSLPLYNLATSPLLNSLRLPGILSRLGVVERLKLSPEGYGRADMERLVRWLHARGERLFVLSLHSPSIVPGHTPYVRSERDLETFLADLDGFLRFFMTRLNGKPTDPLAVHAGFARPGQART